jgi:hypothetical protein
MVKLQFNGSQKPYSNTQRSRDYTKFEQRQALANCRMVDWAEMCMQQSILDENYDVLEKTSRSSLPQKRSWFLLKKKP